MADADYSMTTVEVKVFLTVFVPYVATFSLDNIDVKKGVNIEKFHCFVKKLTV
jgi:hypothetical protein